MSGSHSLVEGTFVWTDYAYDDRGANTDDGDRTVIDDAGGDATYPEPLTNAADLIQLQVGPGEADDEIQVTTILETLTDPSIPAVVVGFDTDEDVATGSPALPFVDWDPSEPLGVDEVLVLSEDGGRTFSADADGAWNGEGPQVDVEVDADENLLRATLPIVRPAADERWRVVAVTALADELGSDPRRRVRPRPTTSPSWATRSRTSGRTTCRPTCSPGGRRPYGGDHLAVGTIDGADLGGDESQVDLGHEPGFQTFLYQSELELAEGISSADDGLVFVGPYQPYLVWSDEDGPQPDEPLTLFLHGSQQNHLGTVAVGGSYLGTARPLSEEVHELAQYAVDGVDFEPHTTTVWPLARGEALGYEGIAEQDVLDVLADATERFAPDADRIILTGASMGGIGTFRMGTRYPDRWSVVAPLIGFATEETQPLLTNLTGVPIRQINGLVDPLIDAAAAEATTDRLDELELEYRAWMLDDRGHEAGGFVYDCVYATLPDFERDPTPARISYTVDPSLPVVDPATGLDTTYDGAWWVDGIEPAGTGLATVEAFSAARTNVELQATHVDRRGLSGPEGGDLCGDNPEVTTGDAWRERAVELEVVDEEPVDDRLDLVLTAVAAVTLEFEGAGIDAGDEVVLAVRSDGETMLTLTGLAPGQEVVAGDERTEADDDGHATVALPEGQTTVEVAAT